MDAVAREGVEEYGERSHEGLTFTRCHLSNLSLVEDDAAEELHVVVNHIPHRLVAACLPMVHVDSLVALDADEILGDGEVAVEVRSRDDDFLILGKASGSLLDDGKRLRQGLIHRLLVDFEDVLLQFVNLVEQRLAVFQFRGFHLRLQIGNLSPVLLGRSQDAGL